MNRNLERSIRNLVDLPEDDWQPEHWATFEAAREHLRREIDQIDRARAAEAERKKHRTAGWWTMNRARPVVRERSGGVCELAGPGCLGKAREVHHVFGRGGFDPHNPVKLLHLCGHGNTDGCHGWVHQTREGRDAAEARAAELSEHLRGAS